MSAQEQMNDALLRILEEGSRPPCGYGADKDDHPCFSDAQEARADAARLCRHCPLFTRCQDLAEEIRPSCGVWAGIDWSNVKRKRGAS